MNIRKYLRNKKLLCDGAFGTYFSVFDSSMTPEEANTKNKELVKKIHLEYIASGAKLLRTNTFASNYEMLKCTRDELVENIRAGYRIACEAVKESEKEVLFVAADIGPLKDMSLMPEEEIYDEYKLICDTFLEEGANIFIFETFPDYVDILRIVKELKAKNKELFIAIQFCVNQHGYTETGISAKKLLESVAKIDEFDAIGLNCGIGPGHMYQILKSIDIKTDKYLTALPNASYPKMIQDRMVFMDNGDYFVNKLRDICSLNIDLLGGCCGTNPKYIKKAAYSLDFTQKAKEKSTYEEEEIEYSKSVDNSFYKDKDLGEKIIAVELSPPANADSQKIMDAANILKNMKVDVITFPDSPSGRTRTDSILMASKILNEVNINVMPHICCRDKNAIAMRSQLLGAHINGVKNALVITGDPVPSMIRKDVKSVFNFDSVGAMKIINEMNENEFEEDNIVFGGALGLGRKNLDVEIGRMKKKIAAGASFFLTQPVFTKEEIDRLEYIKSQVNTKILLGIMPLVSLKNATFIKNEMPGINITDEILRMYRSDMTREQGEEVGIKIAKKIMAMTKDTADGYYFSIPFNRVYLLEEIL